MPKTYSEKMSRRTIVMATVILLLALVALVAKPVLREWGGIDERWLGLGVVLVGFAPVFVLGGQFWKNLDDIQREGHAVSWYWGSIGGLAIAACIITASGLARSEFALGVATLIVLQLVCSLAFYAFWWLKGRGFSLRSGE